MPNVPTTTNEGQSLVSSELSSKEVSNEIAGLILSATNGAQQGNKAFGCFYPRGALQFTTAAVNI
jgi:hypothetical protein